MPNNSLERLSLLYPGLSHNFTPILDAQGRFLKSLQWHNFEGLSSRRPILPEIELQKLHVTAPNLKSMTLDLNRPEDEDWPWESLKALRQGLPQGLEHLTIWFEMASECRRQKGDTNSDSCREPCLPAEKYAQPLLTVEAARTMSRFLLRDGPPALSRISFFAGYPADYELLNGHEENWLFGERAALECGVTDGERIGTSTVVTGLWRFQQLKMIIIHSGTSCRMSGRRLYIIYIFIVLLFYLDYHRRHFI